MVVNSKDLRCYTAIQWFKNGDHPLDDCREIEEKVKIGDPVNTFLSEGKFVRYFRHPYIPGKNLCPNCHKTIHEHGWIDNNTLDKNGKDLGITVCPGDWIIAPGIEEIEWSNCFVVSPEIFEVLFFRIDTAIAADTTEIKNEVQSQVSSVNKIKGI